MFFTVPNYIDKQLALLAGRTGKPTQSLWHEIWQNARQNLRARFRLEEPVLGSVFKVISERERKDGLCQGLIGGLISAGRL